MWLQTNYPKKFCIESIADRKEFTHTIQQRVRNLSSGYAPCPFQITFNQKCIFLLTFLVVWYKIYSMCKIINCYHLDLQAQPVINHTNQILFS